MTAAYLKYVEEYYTMNIYIAGPMSGLPNFNRQSFEAAEQHLRAQGFSVIFNPIRQDIEMYGEDFFEGCPTGSAEEAAKFNFSLRKSLSSDLSWICENADAIYMLDGWQYSKGARTEHALAVALGLKIIYEQ